MIPAVKFHGLVLAGGHSSRMGTDKAALVHPDGRSLVVRCRDLLRETGCEMVKISLRCDQELPSGITEGETVRDPDGASLGPVAGIVASMDFHESADWLVIACDLPRLDVATLKHLIASKAPDEMFLAYRSEKDGLPEPLCGLYASDALPLLRQAVADGRRSLRQLLIGNRCRLLDPVTLRALENVNTPDDWENATML